MVKLGELVQDRVTGLKGIATQKLDFINGNVQFTVQPKGEGDKIPDAYNIDHQQLQRVEFGVSDLVQKPADEPKFELGQRVIDMASGVEGILAIRHTFINGCIYYAMQAKAPDNPMLAGVPDASFIDRNRLKLVDQGIKPEVKKAVRFSKGTGGPTTRAVSSKARGFTLIELLIAMIAVTIIGLILAPLLSSNRSDISFGVGGMVETRCISGYKFVISQDGTHRQVMDEFGKGVKC